MDLNFLMPAYDEERALNVMLHMTYRKRKRRHVLAYGHRMTLNLILLVTC